MRKIFLILFCVLLSSLSFSQSNLTDYEKFISTPNTIITKTELHVEAYPAKPLPFSVYLIKVTKESQSKFFVRISTPKYSSSGKLSNEWYTGIYPIEEIKTISLNVDKFLNFLSGTVSVKTEMLFATSNGLTIIATNNHTTTKTEVTEADKKRALLMGNKVPEYDPESDKYLNIYLDNEKSYLPLEIKDFEAFKKMFNDILNAVSTLK